MTTKTLVYIESNNHVIERVSKEIISHVRHFFADSTVYGVIVGDEYSIEAVLPELKNLGLENVFVIQNPLLSTYNVCTYSNVIAQLISNISPDVFLMGATSNGRELAPRIASKLDIGLTADCTDLQLDIDEKLLATRPTYGGKMMATIISKTKPNFATVRQGAFKLRQIPMLHTEISYFDANVADVAGMLDKYEILKTEDKEQPEDWTNADVIVAGGLGLKSKENFELIYRLAELLNAKPAASRAAVELGWAPQSIQVGQTGTSVTPKLYIAFGISGALQHMIGLTNAQKIIAVNIDKNAPIMNTADIAIPADAVEVINYMLSKLSD